MGVSGQLLEPMTARHGGELDDMTLKGRCPNASVNSAFSSEILVQPKPQLHAYTVACGRLPACGLSFSQR
jgi:hypothetical protein